MCSKYGPGVLFRFRAHMWPEILSLDVVSFTEGAGQLPDSTSLTSPVVTSKYRVPGGNSNSNSASFEDDAPAESGIPQSSFVKARRALTVPIEADPERVPLQLIDAERGSSCLDPCGLL